VHCDDEVMEIHMALPHNFKRIRMNLARSTDFPGGSDRHGYELVAPLDADGHIDPGEWHSHRENCRVIRFWAGESDRVGRLVHKPGGNEHARWIFDYDRSRDDDDEAGYRFASHRFVPGEYVTVSDGDQSHTFRVVSVENAT
jgi:hypothetical protein